LFVYVYDTDLFMVNVQTPLNECRLGGVVVSVLSTVPKARGFEAGQGDGFLRAMKIRSTPSSRMGSKAGSLTGMIRLNSHFLRPPPAASEASLVMASSVKS
jgi:hypothetical protein